MGSCWARVEKKIERKMGKMKKEGGGIKKDRSSVWVG